MTEMKEKSNQKLTKTRDKKAFTHPIQPQTHTASDPESLACSQVPLGVPMWLKIVLTNISSTSTPHTFPTNWRCYATDDVITTGSTGNGVENV